MGVLGILMKNRIFFFDLTFIGAGFSMVEGMLFLLLRDLQASTFLCGLSVVVTVIFELPIFAYAKPLLERLGTRRMILLGQTAWVVRAVYYANMSAPWTVLLIEPLHGVTFALVWTAAIDYVARPTVCGEGLEASAQGLLTACFNGVGPIIGLILGGVLFDKVGGHAAYAIFAVLILLPGLAYWLLGAEENADCHAGAGTSSQQPGPVLHGSKLKSGVGDDLELTTPREIVATGPALEAAVADCNSGCALPTTADVLGGQVGCGASENASLVQ